METALATNRQGYRFDPVYEGLTEASAYDNKMTAQGR